jgi:hypothetical protein
MSSVVNINELLKDKLYQVIGSTPTSIAESLVKANIRNKPEEGAQIFAISIFAAAVNKSTLETFIADPRFSAVRSLLSATISIQGKTNMTALTLLGHCLLTTDVADGVVFASEFRKKMGQTDLWVGELASGSLSVKQREILKEKKRVTSQTEAKALGRGFLKYTGIIGEAMTAEEAAMFKVAFTKAEATSVKGKTRAQEPVTADPKTSGTTKERTTTTPDSPTAAYDTRKARVSDPDPYVAVFHFTLGNGNIVEVPADVVAYRKDMLRHSDDDIVKSLERNGVAGFVVNTRSLMERDPDGTKTLRGASVVGSQVRT